MDTLFYRILLLFVGLAFLFIQSGEYQSFKIKVKVLPLFVDFAKWARFMSFPSSDPDSPQEYPVPVLAVAWEDLERMSAKSLHRLRADLMEQNQSLLVIYPVFSQVWRDAPLQWKRYQDLPISHWELSAAGAAEASEEWQLSLLPEFVSTFDVMIGQLRAEFRDTQLLAWGAFQQPDKAAYQMWNHLLASQQKNIDGYALIIDKLDLQTFQYLMKLKPMLVQPQHRAKSLGLHLKNTSPDTADELTSFVFLVNMILGMPLAYLSYQKIPNKDIVFSADTLLERLFWRKPRLHHLQFVGGQPGQLQDLYGWYWEKKWENGAILVNLGKESQKIHSTDLFPSFFFQEIFSISEEAKEGFSLKKGEGFHKVTLPPESIAFLSTKQMLPHVSHEKIKALLAFEVEVSDRQQLKMTYYLAEATAQLGIRVLDMGGQEVYAWQQQNASKGYYVLHHQRRHFMNGKYVCSVQMGHQNLLYTFDINQERQI